MKLAMILSRFPYPLEKGDKLRAYHQLKELSTKHDVYLFCLTDQNVESLWMDEVKQYCSELHIYQLNRPGIYWNTTKQLFGDKPFQVGYFYHKPIHKKIKAELKRIQPDHIYSQLIRTAEYVKLFPETKKTIDYMDAFGMGMKRRASISKGIRKFLFTMEGKRLTEYENRIFDFFDHHTIISEQDKGHINHPENSKITVIENGISSDFFNFDKNIEPTFELVFTGNMNYPPNVECAEYIAKEILPELRKKSTAQLLLSGANPHPRVQSLGQMEGVTVTGWVEDIRDSYAQGKVFVAPLFIGTGLQNKLLEAMAMGIPCVTTPLANNALKAVETEEILIAETKEQFVQKIEELLGNAEMRSSLGKNGRAFVQRNYDWAAATARLSDLFES